MRDELTAELAAAKRSNVACLLHARGRAELRPNRRRPHLERCGRVRSELRSCRTRA